MDEGAGEREDSPMYVKSTHRFVSRPRRRYHIIAASASVASASVASASVAEAPIEQANEQSREPRGRAIKL
jgi:hypothetical protein